VCWDDWCDACPSRTALPPALLLGRDADAEIDLAIAYLASARGRNGRLQEGAEDVGRDRRPTVQPTSIVIGGEERAAAPVAGPVASVMAWVDLRVGGGASACGA
jgi:hypothetical protein